VEKGGDSEFFFRLETNNQPGRTKKKMNKDWKLGVSITFVMDENVKGG
jgi:hypothetical protein